MRLFSTILLATTIAIPKQGSPDAVLDKAVAAYAKVRTVQATFTQTLTNPLTGSTQTARGEMVQQRPSKLAVRFTQPAGDMIVADGQALWVYLPSSDPKQVLKMKPAMAASGTPDVAAQFLESPKTRYTVTAAGAATVEGHATHALNLVPKQNGMPFTKATIWVDDNDGLVRQFETTDANGVVRHVTITKLTINGPVDRSAFTFVPPRGVEVFDQTSR